MSTSPCFEWLEAELRAIGTRKFLITGIEPNWDRLREVETQWGPLPDDYKSFLQEYGGVRLVRWQYRSYQVEVDADPKMFCPSDGNRFLAFGVRSGEPAYLASGPARSVHPTVLEHRTCGIVDTRKSFARWLKEGYDRCRKDYGKKKWAAIMAGPTPFTEEEGRAVAARRLWSVESAGVDERGNLILDIHNGSEVALKFITVSIRRGRLKSSVAVRTEHIGPGTHARCRINFFNECTKSADIEILPLAHDIGPEDRELLYELGGPSFFREHVAAGKPVATERLS